MSKAVENLEKWFSALTDQQRNEVLDFLYGGKVLMTKGEYVGPSPELVKKGLFTGPAPAQNSAVCGACQRPL